MHSSVTATASQVAERDGVPFMNGESSSPITGRLGVGGAGERADQERGQQPRARGDGMS